MDEDKRKAEEGIPKPATMNEDEGKVEEMMPKPAKPPRKKNKIPVRKRLKPVKRHKQSTVSCTLCIKIYLSFKDRFQINNFLFLNSGSCCTF